MDNWLALPVKIDDEQTEDLITGRLNQLGAYLTCSQDLQTIYFEEHLQSEVITILAEYGIELLQSSPVPNENWVQKSQSVWTNIITKNLKIIPVADNTSISKADELFIIPGTGFGTGHHATTKTIIEVLQSANFENFKPKNVLDFGTGSGILAIACQKLFPSTVIAIDNDPLALENAKDNIALNNVNNIELSLKDISELAGKFDLIIANIYAEVLCRHEVQLYNKLNDAGLLVLSGIMSSLKEMLLEKFQNWKLLEQHEVDGWVTLVYTKCEVI